MAVFADIYPRYRDFVFRICSRYARSRQDAEDLTQETFVKASQRLDGFRQESELGTWLYRVAVNGCLDYLRRIRREEKNLEAFLDDMVVRNLDSGGDRVLARLELDRILGKFRPVLRRTLFLTLAEGLTYAEAAEILGMTSSAVAKVVSRFLEKSRSGAFDRKRGPALARGGITGNARKSASTPPSSTPMSKNPLSKTSKRQPREENGHAG